MSWDRQRRLDGFENWHFHLVIENLLVTLQPALLLLASALLLCPWKINHTAAWITIFFVLPRMVSYVFFTLAAILHYNCPYQMPPSIVILTLARYLVNGRRRLLLRKGTRI